MHRDPAGHGAACVASDSLFRSAGPKAAPDRMTSTTAARRFDGVKTDTLTSDGSLELELHGDLDLPWIADTLAQEAVEVEQRRRRERVDVVGVVERIEHLDARN